MKSLRIAGMSVLLVGTSLFGGATTATAAPTIGCGSVITANTTLRADVGPCPGDGLTVTASGVHLDLHGHNVIGSGMGGVFVGIRLQDVNDVTVTGDGSVSGFDAGVVVFHGHGNTVQKLEVFNNSDAQYVADNPDLGQFGDGIIVYGSSNNRVVRNSVHDNGPFSGITVLTETDLVSGLVTGPTPVGNVIDRNNVSHNNVDDVCPSDGGGGSCPPGAGVYSEDIGIRVEGPGAANTTISNNIASWNGRTGISPLNTVSRFAPLANIPPNVDTLIVGNDIEHDGIATTIYDTDPTIGPVEGDGIFNRCYRGSPQKGCPVRTVIEGNYVAHNTASGIDLQVSKGTTVIGNVSLFNNIDYTNTFVSQVNTAGPYDDGTDNNTNPACDSNTWLNNVMRTGSQPCVFGHSGAAAPAVAARPVSAEGAGLEPVPARHRGRIGV